MADYNWDLLYPAMATVQSANQRLAGGAFETDYLIAYLTTYFNDDGLRAIARMDDGTYGMFARGHLIDRFEENDWFTGDEDPDIPIILWYKGED